MNRTSRSAAMAALSAALLLTACASAPLPPPRPCEHHCSTHTDGYEWAQRGNLTDPQACAGAYPDAFIRGCRNGVEDLEQLRPSSEGI